MTLYKDKGRWKVWEWFLLMYHGITKIINNEFVWSYLGETRHSEINYPYGDEGETVACDCLVIGN